MGRQADAQGAYRRGLELSPADANLHGNLALSLAAAGRIDAALGATRAAGLAPLPDPRQDVNAVPVLANWTARNTLPEGGVAFPADGHLRAGGDGRAVLDAADTPETHNILHHVEHALDKAALVGGVRAGGAVVIGSGGTLAPAVLVAAGLYTAARSGQDLYETAGRHGSINPWTAARPVRTG